MLPRRASLVGLPNWVGLQAVLCNHSWSGGALGCAPLSDVVTGWTPCSGPQVGRTIEWCFRLFSVIKWCYRLSPETGQGCRPSSTIGKATGCALLLVKAADYTFLSEKASTCTMQLSVEGGCAAQSGSVSV